MLGIKALHCSAGRIPHMVNGKKPICVPYPMSLPLLPMRGLRQKNGSQETTDKARLFGVNKLSQLPIEAIWLTYIQERETTMKLSLATVLTLSHYSPKDKKAYAAWLFLSQHKGDLSVHAEYVPSMDSIQIFLTLKP